MRRYYLLTTVWCVAVLWSFWGAGAAAQVPTKTQAPEATARAMTFHRDGTSYYALSLETAVSNLPRRNDAAAVVVLFDTSASQQGGYRAVALAALDTMLTSLRPTDQVALWAVDLGAQPLTSGLVGPRSEALRQAVAQLRQQVPLGSTDLAAALTAANQPLVAAEVAAKTIVYIGDGISAANVLDSPTLKQVVDQLRQSRISVSSLAVGPQVDAQLLAVLANHTGGNLYVQPAPTAAEGGDDEQAAAADLRHARLVGQDLADWVSVAVYWPQQVDYPVSLGQSYPEVMPPLRSDRETVLVGQTDDFGSASTLRLQAVGPTGPVEFQWNVQADPPQEDHAYLVEVVDGAQADAGLSLPTVGAAGLAEAARLIGARMDQLAELSQRALASGDHQAAQRIAQAVLRADAGNAQARTVQHMVSRDERPQPAGAAGAGPGWLNSIDRDGEFLKQVEQERRVFAEMLSKEIQNVVLDARSTMTSQPRQAMQDLKLALESVQRATDLTAAKRAVLVGKLRTALQEAGYQVTLKDELDRQREAELAASQARKLLNERLTRRIEREDQLMARFSALMDERQFVAAEEVAQIAEEVDPGGVTPRVATLGSRQKRAYHLQQVARAARHQGYFDAMYQTELSHIPFPDVPPIIYPDAEVWEDLTNRRRKYASIDLSARSKSEERIQAILREPLKAPLDYEDEPLIDVLQQLQEEYEIPIQIDTAALDELAISPETEVTAAGLRNISLRSALNLMLRQPGLEDLTYVFDQEVLLITTIEKANETLQVKVYPVADLVLPIINLGSGGGVGGVGGGGIGGGGGGGFGGGGGGGGFGGGGGGGFGGGGGGGGGGFFNVADEVAADAEPLADASPATAAPQVSPQSRPAAQTDLNWSERFAQKNFDPSWVRAQAKHWMRQGQPAQVVAMLQAALRHGQAQPWMYESLGIAMELAGEPPAEIERAIMSACDFTDSPEELMLIAQYLSHLGFDARAVGIYQQVIKSAPLHYEAYVLGLRAAERAGSTEGLRWAILGVLQHDWPLAQQEIVNLARRVAKAVLAQMQTAADDAQLFQRELEQALVRDVVIRVSWSGEADIDLIVEEPGGTVCSVQQPRTAGGGVCLGDAFASRDNTQSAEGLSEEYRCARGFPGT